jgi:superfamily II DNA or RNA helicase
MNKPNMLGALYIHRREVGKIKLRPYQRDILDNFMGHRFNILMSSRQSGKTISASIFYTTLYLI